MGAKYWLVKSEPSVYSISDLSKEKTKTTYWDGVRNYQARNFIRDDMKIGDLVLYYHSNDEPLGVAGYCEIVRESYPDFTAQIPDNPHFDPKSTSENPIWYMVDIKLIKIFKKVVGIADMKENPKLQAMRLLQRGNRLSVMPVSEQEFHEILMMAGE